MHGSSGKSAPGTVLSPAAFHVSFSIAHASNPGRWRPGMSPEKNTKDLHRANL